MMRNDERQDATIQQSPPRQHSIIGERNNAQQQQPNKQQPFTPEKPRIFFDQSADDDAAVLSPGLSLDDTSNPAMSPNRASSSGSLEQHIGPSAPTTLVEKPAHRRDLSAHFQDATRLTDDIDVYKRGNEYPTQSARPSRSTRPFDGSAEAVFAGISPTMSPTTAPPPAQRIAAGSKHRRGFSGGVSNPSVAHRRINSIGDSAQVGRYGYYGGYHCHYPPPSRANYYSYHHRRENSAGLDILSAAADESNEQLEIAAGKNRPTSETTKANWDSLVDSNIGRRMDPPQPVTSHYDYPHSLHGHHQVAGTSDLAYSYNRSSASNHQQQHHGRMNYYRQPHHSDPSFYPPPPPDDYSHHAPLQPRNSSAYPVQYAPLKDDSYSSVKSHTRPKLSDKWPERLDTDERLFQQKPSDSRGGASTVFGMVPFGDKNNRGIAGHRHSNSRGTTSNTTQGDQNSPIPLSNVARRHRKLSSYSSLAGLMGSALFPDPEQQSSSAAAPVVSAPNGRHHRSTSSSVSLLQGLEGGSDLFFLQHVHAGGDISPGGMKPRTSATEPNDTHCPVHVVSNTEASGHALAAGGTSKRIRRKCNVANCPNRVVQGGLCISHGAKRKTCKYPGCDKNVKKAGLCSTHGPARKRCDAEDCNKVAVQGGRCIAHGAKKKLCEYPECTKQAILSGMCKKHHDVSSSSGAYHPQSRR